MKKKIEKWQIIAILMAAYDAVAVLLAYFLALWGRFDFAFSQIPEKYLSAYISCVPVFALASIAIFAFFKMYKGIWCFVSFSELLHTMAGSLVSSALHTVLMLIFVCRMPLIYYFAGALLQFCFLIAIRFAYRGFIFIKGRANKKQIPSANRVMLIGGGNAGQEILRDINRAKETDDKVVCIIDDNPNKWGRYIENVPIVGGRDEILSAVETFKISKIYLTMPSASASTKRDILNICNETGCELKQLPGLYQFVTGQLTVSAMRDVSVEDLLGREPVKTDLQEILQFIHGKTVLVTGGGGSIGSELCRQIAAACPKRLIIFDIYENNAYEIQLELKDKHPELDLVTLIGSVRDSRRIFGVFEQYRPDIVYHAAAHKHVPLMEDSPCEAIKNNVIGTYKTAYAAMVHGCQRFVLISTDKAVNPTNVMGASKRLCEMVIQGFDAKIKAGRAADLPQLFTHDGVENADRDGTGEIFRHIKTEFVAVRFGNVLGSNGSVIPIFKKQIEKGGPITVTHPDIIRYFMTIPEAVSLVMLAGTYAKGGEIFVLDMGSPVKIDTLARNLIKLSGLKPDVDIKIEYTGLRPGEKLYEEKLMAEEGLRRTENHRIHIGQPIEFDIDRFFTELEEIMDAAYANRPTIREKIMAMVPTYHPVGVNGQSLADKPALSGSAPMAEKAEKAGV